MNFILLKLVTRHDQKLFEKQFIKGEIVGNLSNF